MGALESNNTSFVSDDDDDALVAWKKDDKFNIIRLQMDREKSGITTGMALSRPCFFLINKKMVFIFILT